MDLHLPPKLLGACSGRLERGDQRHLHLRFRAPDFRFAELMRSLGQTVERGRDHFDRVAVRRAGVEAEQTGVRIVPVKE